VWYVPLEMEGDTFSDVLKRRRLENGRYIEEPS